MTNDKKNVRIVFPGDNRIIVSEIMERNGLKESDDDAFEKILNGLPSEGGKMAKIIKKTALGEVSIRELPSVLSKNFKLTEGEAKKLAKEIEEKVLILSREVLEGESTGKELPPEKKEAFIDVEDDKNKEIYNPPTPLREIKSPNQKDTYREPVE